MARVRISKEYDERLKELLDAAQELFFSKGYQQVSVSDIIQKVGVAKGTFYHYFKSKSDLLDQLVNRFSEMALERAKSVVEDPDLKALEKLKQFIATVRSAKEENLELMKMVMKVLYRDDNLLLRHKMFSRSSELSAPLFSRIIREGTAEGVFSPVDVEEVSSLIMAMGFHLNETIVRMLLHAGDNPETFDVIERKLKTYERSVERLLGAPEGSFMVGDRSYIEMFKVEVE